MTTLLQSSPISLTLTERIKVETTSKLIEDNVNKLFHEIINQFKSKDKLAYKIIYLNKDQYFIVKFKDFDFIINVLDLGIIRDIAKKTSVDNVTLSTHGELTFYYGKPNINISKNASIEEIEKCEEYEMIANSQVFGYAVSSFQLLKNQELFVRNMFCKFLSHFNLNFTNVQIEICDADEQKFEVHIKKIERRHFRIQELCQIFLFDSRMYNLLVSNIMCDFHNKGFILKVQNKKRNYIEIQD